MDFLQLESYWSFYAAASDEQILEINFSLNTDWKSPNLPALSLKGYSVSAVPDGTYLLVANTGTFMTWLDLHIQIFEVLRKIK